MIGGFLQCKNFEQMSCDEATPKEARLSIPIRLSANGFRKEKKKSIQNKDHSPLRADTPHFLSGLS